MGKYYCSNAMGKDFFLAAIHQTKKFLSNSDVILPTEVFLRSPFYSPKSFYYAMLSSELCRSYISDKFVAGAGKYAVTVLNTLTVGNFEKVLIDIHRDAKNSLNRALDQRNR